MKTTFFDRLTAYFIDLIILSLITTIISFSGITTTSSEYEDRLMDLTESYTSSEITNEEFIDEYSTILYENQKDNILGTGISLGLIIAYFVVFQYMNKGQTLGKKILHIRVVDKDTNKPTTIIKGLIRSLLIFNIVSGIANILFIYILNKNNYFLGYGLISGIELLFTIITLFFIIYRKDGRGLHDMMSNTTVIKERS